MQLNLALAKTVCLTPEHVFCTTVILPRPWDIMMQPLAQRLAQCECSIHAN